MIDKIKGISIQGRCFPNDTSLMLYPNTNDRISVIYGKNGSGKSTISMGFNNLTSDMPVSDISIKLLGDSGSVLNTEEYKNNIFVFNEQYIDTNVKIDDDGLSTIILLGGQVDIQADIDKHTELETKRKSEWERAQEKLAEYQTKSNPLSPEYHLDKIRAMLKRPGGWAETESKIKSLKQNASVRDDIMVEICKLNPTETVENLKKKFQEKKDLLDKISDSSLSFAPLICDCISLEDGFEGKICALLSQVIEKPVLTEREKQILQAIQNGQQMLVEESKNIFADESTTHCPYCYQPLQAQYKQELLDNINRVLNKDVENHKAELAAISFPPMDEDYSKYDSLNSELVKKINLQKEKCLDLIKAYKEKIEQKIGNTYTPIVFAPNGLTTSISAFNSLLEKLKQEIDEFTNAITRRKKIVLELVAINKAIAHFDVQEIYRSYLKQDKDKKAKEEEVKKAFQEFQKETQILRELQLKKSNISLAISNINNALEYVFFSQNRLSIELRNEKYYLKSNGKDVLPKNVSLGERNIVALCYFFTQIMSNQEVSKLYQSEALVVVDDPVSSFDFENRVGILSYIRYQVDCLIKGNRQSKILILTHDLTTAFDLRKAMDEVANSTKGIAQIQKTNSILQELKTNQLFPFKEERNEYEQLIQTIYRYANGDMTDCSVTIGNVMRRALEAFSTFNYRKGIADVSCDKNVLNVLGEKSEYFNNLMYRLVLHGESHYSERVYSLRDDTNFYEFVSDDEKKRTAKDILCFMYLLNPAHIQAYLQTIANSIANIKQWSKQIKDNSSFSLTTATQSKKHKIRLYDLTLCAGMGDNIDDNVPYTEYETDEMHCDFALKVSGDSMEPDIPNGSIVLVKICDSVNSGEIGAFYYDGVAYCKRVLLKNGKCYLESINSKYPTVEILPENTLKVYGKIVGVEIDGE